MKRRDASALAIRHDRGVLDVVGHCIRDAGRLDFGQGLIADRMLIATVFTERLIVLSAGRRSGHHSHVASHWTCRF
jgi:hypothetical protein